MLTLKSAAAASAALISIRCHQAGNQLHTVSTTITRRHLLIVSYSKRKQHVLLDTKSSAKQFAWAKMSKISKLVTGSALELKREVA